MAPTCDVTSGTDLSYENGLIISSLIRPFCLDVFLGHSTNLVIESQHAAFVR